MDITINGQLLLTMLAEKLVDNIPNLTMLQVNTDGVTVKIKKEYYDKLINICNSWEKLTNLELEYAEYSKMVIRDVNNYIAEYTNGDTKCKGSFEIERDWHKDQSMKIVRKSVFNYFIKNIPIDETIEKGDAWDFIKAFSVTKGWTAEEHTVKGVNKLQKTNRYLISKNGNGFYKHHEDNRLHAIEAGYGVIILNDINNPNKYSDCINRQYYIKECWKIINAVENKQLTLF
jgi:hypothetical protein